MAGSDLNEAAGSPGQPGHRLSPLLARAGFRHAFFTRRGGVSRGPYASLSFSTAVGDEPADVERNLELAGRLLGVDGRRILYLSQVHGAEAYFYHEDKQRSETITLEGDCIGGTRPDSAYAVRSADCVPVLIADVHSGAVMAVHAGWRGVVAGAVEAGVARLRQSAGKDSRLLAAIGPHISLSAFEVSEEVAAELAAACPAPGAVDGRARGVERRRDWPRPHVDLRFIVTKKLLALGLEEDCIDQVGGCTFLDQDDFFSFRRDGKRSGRHLSAIVPSTRAR